MHPEPTEPILDVESLRAREFPHVHEAVYLNAASLGPLPERARRAADEHQRRRMRAHALTDADFVDPLRRSRAAAARLIGADADEIALGGNTSYGINLVALGLAVEPGSRVVVSDREFPANVYPWMAMPGAELEIVPTDARGMPDEARLLEQLERDDVSVLALSAVQFATGYHAELERFGRACRERGVVFVVDAIQALGQVPLDVRAAQIDVLACGGHKWLCAPFGTGFTYVRREVQGRIEPRVIGWSSMEASRDLSALLDYRWGFRPDARRYEVGTLAVQDFAGFAASAELLLEIGVERIESHVRHITEPLVDWLRRHPEVEPASDLAPERRTGILSFRPPRAEAVFARLSEAGVVCGLREGAIRMSAHLYNTREEVERVVDLLEGSVAR